MEANSARSLSLFIMADSFKENILGVQNLIESGINKVNLNGQTEEGVDSELTDNLTLRMDDRELIILKRQWESLYNPYISKLSPRQKQNKVYYEGTQIQSGLQSTKGVSSNLIFEAEETFIPQALSKNPEPVVWSDNTEEGKAASNDIKSMLQFKADTLGLRKKLGVTLRHWSIYFIGVLKHGWDKDSNDFITEVRKPKNFILDPNGYVDEFGDFKGEFLGERISCTAEELIKKFPKSRSYVLLKTDGKLGTRVTYTEWWTNEYCFYTFEDEVLDKHKNQFFNYDVEENYSIEEQARYGLPENSVTPGKNHFANPKMPYTFLSVFSMQEQPHDITTLVEQAIPNQDRITERDLQITKNLRTGNNSIAVSGQSFTSETARQAAQALEDGDPVLVPDGQVENAIKRLPASALPSGILESQQIDKDTLKSIFGTLGLSATKQSSDTTARGMILNTDHDSSRIGGGVGEALEQVADNVFNWWLQLMYVFYDEPHYGAIVGTGRAVEFVKIVNSDMNRQFVVSVSPNSMQPKDEITEMNLAIDLYSKGALDPITLFKRLNYPDPMETAKATTLFTINPQQYYMTYFNEMPPMPGQNPNNPLDVGQVPQPVDESLSANEASSALSKVPINAGVATPQ